MTPEEQALGVSGSPVATPTRPTLTAPAMAQFEREFYTMPGDEVKRRYHNDPEFRAKVDAMSEMDQTVPNSGTPDPVLGSVAPAAVPTPEQTPVQLPEAPVVPVTEEESTDEEIYRGEDGRWVAVVDLGDGSGVQRFYGKTRNEVIKALIKAQREATKKIRQQEATRKQADKDRKEREQRAKDAELLLENPEVVEVKRFTSRNLTPDEQWQISQGMQDPAQIAKSLDRYFEARFGLSADQLTEKLNEGEQQKQVMQAVQVGRLWIAKHEDDFYASNKNIETLRKFMEEKGWSVTDKNMEKAYRYLVIHDRFEAFPEESEIPAAEVLPAVSEIPAAVSAPAAPVASAPAQPVAAQPGVPTITIPAIPGTTVVGVRPGSVSTALSPRESSVRSSNVGPRAIELTADEYRRTPMSEVKRRYNTDPAYKAAIDKLIADGKI